VAHSTKRRWRATPEPLRLRLVAFAVGAATVSLLLAWISRVSPVLEALAVLAALFAAVAAEILLASWFLSLAAVTIAYFVVPVAPPGLDRVAAVIEQIERDRRASTRADSPERRPSVSSRR
jgi:hypothetical protein